MKSDLKKNILTLGLEVRLNNERIKFRFLDENSVPKIITIRGGIRKEKKCEG